MKKYCRQGTKTPKMMAHDVPFYLISNNRLPLLGGLVTWWLGGYK